MLKSLFIFNLDSFYSPVDFQTPATPIAEGIIHFHHDLMFLITFIVFFVLWMILRTLQLHAYPNEKTLVLTRGAYSFSYYKHKGVLLEIVWTLVPAFALIFVAIPSFALLYSTSTFCSPELTVKAIGHQWYWSYEISDVPAGGESLFKTQNFDAYLLAEDTTKFNDKFIRNLCTDKLLLLPTQVYIRLLITSDDVLHSWTVPAFGVKVDACPGRLNSVNLIIKREGHYFGQCSEICGVNHAFMPIGIAALPTMGYFFARI
jgi:cytochrome c oxidase subunit 2